MENKNVKNQVNLYKFVLTIFFIMGLILSTAVTVSAVDADFKASIDSVTPMSNTICPTDVIINVTITKISGSELSCIGPVLGTIYDNGALLPTVDTQNISNMCLTLNNDSESFTITVSNISAGSHTFLFSITAIGFTDTNLANNNATSITEFCTGQTPDLTVTAVRTFYNRPSETPLMDFAAMGYPEINYTQCPMNVWIEADIKNQGVVDASNVNVSVYVDSKLIGSSIKNITASESILVDNIIWNLNSSIVSPVKGTHNITVKVDPNYAIDEGSYENNNQLTIFNTTCNFNLTTVLDCSNPVNCPNLTMLDFNTTYQGMSSTINLTLNNSGGSIDNWTLMDLSFSNLLNSTTTLPANFFVSRIIGTCNFTTNNKNHSQGTCITPPGSSEVMNITLSTNLTQTPGSYTGLLNITLTYDNLLNTQLRLANISTRINILNRTTIVAGN